MWQSQPAAWQKVHRPMVDVSHNKCTDAQANAVVKEICTGIPDGSWVGIYYYDPGVNMPSSEAEQVILAMNYCTTH
jgi:hypothetical protein